LSVKNKNMDLYRNFYSIFLIGYVR